MSAKSRRVQWRNPLLGLAVVAACVGAVVTGVSGDSDSGSAAGAAEADAAIANAEACKVDLLCMGDRDVFIAVRICRQRIEQLSDHSVRWTDGAPDGQFSRSRWRNPARDAFTFTFVPDEAEFQFGFGVFVPIIYECDVDIDLKDVLDVRVREGRLPVRLSIHRTDLAKGGLARTSGAASAPVQAWPTPALATRSSEHDIGLARRALARSRSRSGQSSMASAKVAWKS